jgi:hypothetical protein
MTDNSPDTLPEWLYQRFGRRDNTLQWNDLPDDEKSYWAHEAAAVRRAVQRGGFRRQPVICELPHQSIEEEEECEQRRLASAQEFRCNWARTKWPHPAHEWTPQPGMEPLACPGYGPESEDADPAAP